MKKQKLDVKKCTLCKYEKLLTEFCKDKHAKDGHSYMCRECLKLYRLRSKENFKSGAIKAPHKKIPNYEDSKDVQHLTKTCSRCGKTLSLKYFYKCTLTEDGYFDRCYNCCHANQPSSSKSQFNHYLKQLGGKFV